VQLDPTANRIRRLAVVERHVVVTNALVREEATIVGDRHTTSFDPVEDAVSYILAEVHAVRQERTHRLDVEAIGEHLDDAVDEGVANFVAIEQNDTSISTNLDAVITTVGFLDGRRDLLRHIDQIVDAIPLLGLEGIDDGVVVLVAAADVERLHFGKAGYSVSSDDECTHVDLQKIFVMLQDEDHYPTHCRKCQRC